MRFRLGAETNSLEVCPHISADGVQCESNCDRWGYHLQQCPSGGGYFVGHDTTCAEIADLAGGPEGIPGVVVDWKAQVEAWPLKFPSGIINNVFGSCSVDCFAPFSLVCGAIFFSIFGSLALAHWCSQRQEEKPKDPSRVSKWVSDEITFSDPLFRHRRH